MVLHRDIYWLGKQWAVTGYGIQAIDKKLDMKFCELLRIKDGQIAESHLYFDAATLLRQFGLPTPGQPVASGR